MLFFRLTAAVLTAAFTSGASAQNMQLTQRPPVIEAVTAQWVIDLLAQRQFVGVVVDQTPTHDTLEVTSPGGGVFYIAIRACSGDAPKRCSMLQNFALFDASGVTLSQINTMVRDNFAASYAFLNPEGVGVLANKVFLNGGVTEQNIVTEIGGYLYDLDNLGASIRNGQLATVNFEVRHDAAALGKTKIDNGFSLNGDYIVNPVGRNAPTFSTDELRALVE